MTSEEYFDKNGYVIFENFLEKDFINLISNYFENKINREEWKEDVKYETSRYSYYADPLIEVVLLMSKNPIEEFIKKQLIPTYSYSRIYQNGEELKRHVDRPSCEISVTINVASVGKKSPIYMEYKNITKEIFLEPGDAVIYKGCETYHWRKPLNENDLVVQFMLHYVDKNGLYSEYSKDKRLKYGLKHHSKEKEK